MSFDTRTMLSCPRCGRQCPEIAHSSGHRPTCMMGFRADRPDPILAGAWVVCAPGDPTARQWRAVREMANGDGFCATRWNERSRWVRVEIERGNETTDTYTIGPDGRSSHYIGTESE